MEGNRSSTALPRLAHPAHVAGTAARVRSAVVRCRAWLLNQQHADGYWVGELEGDTILESEYVLMLAFLGKADSHRALQAARYLLEEQLPGGGWALYPGGPLELSASVKAYFALKLTGHDPAEPALQRAREAILAAGGADRVNSFTRFYLALLGQIPYDCCPAVPPEMTLLPRWSPVNLHSVSAWSRTIFVPLSIVSARQPVVEVRPQHGIRELFIRPPRDWPPLRSPGAPERERLFSWQTFFRATDRLLRFCQRHRLLPLRRRAIARAQRWMLQRFEDSDGLGAIFPPMVWSVVALRCLGYADDSPEMGYCLEQLAGLEICEDDKLRLQPCLSPVWDTAIALRALQASGAHPTSAPLRRAARWLLDRQIDVPGDWSANARAAPGGWCFEFANCFYPDVDDTAMVLMALREQLGGGPAASVGLPPEFQLVATAEEEDRGDALEQISEVDRLASAIEKGEKWMLALQNRDGGWGAFDKDNDLQFLCAVPFADHNAMIDPSTPDLTARALEALGALGGRVGHRAIDRGLAYLRRTQEADGSWYGRWGVNYIYGTWQVLTGLAAVGVPPEDPAVQAGAAWLAAYQQPCGGWGESPASYHDPALRGQGTPTASQTAWAVLGLLAAGWADHPAVERGIEYLLARQNEDGTWDEPEFTGTGFPLVFYLRYHLYPVYFPLLALSRWAAHGAGQVTGGS